MAIVLSRGVLAPALFIPAKLVLTTGTGTDVVFAAPSSRGIVPAEALNSAFCFFIFSSNSSFSLSLSEILVSIGCQTRSSDNGSRKPMNSA